MLPSIFHELLFLAVLVLLVERILRVDGVQLDVRAPQARSVLRPLLEKAKFVQQQVRAVLAHDLVEGLERLGLWLEALLRHVTKIPIRALFVRGPPCCADAQDLRVHRDIRTPPPLLKQEKVLVQLLHVLRLGESGNHHLEGREAGHEQLASHFLEPPLRVAAGLAGRRLWGLVRFDPSLDDIGLCSRLHFGALLALLTLLL
mmetsp:Transcript_137193/g.438739  ORF Transcript_137193/g.438739 Transcript_137193/m.438739 type:complete len:202 (-) Transcript_137193:1367-1972(-)